MHERCISFFTTFATVDAYDKHKVDGDVRIFSSSAPRYRTTKINFKDIQKYNMVHHSTCRIEVKGAMQVVHEPH